MSALEYIWPRLGFRAFPRVAQVKGLRAVAAPRAVAEPRVGATTRADFAVRAVNADLRQGCADRNAFAPNEAENPVEFLEGTRGDTRRPPEGVDDTLERRLLFEGLVGTYVCRLAQMIPENITQTGWGTFQGK